MRRLIVLAILAACCAVDAAEDKKAATPSVKGKQAYTLVPSDYNPFAPVKPLTPSQVFEKVKDSVVVVKAIGADGKTIGLGSGVLLPAGKIGTNCHVLKGGVRFQVGGSRKFVAATLWGGDEDKDICLLEAKGLNGKSAQLGQASRLKVGEPVYAVGSPRGLELSLSEGIVSQLRGGSPPYIQTTAAISPGSSGGGLFDDKGRLIGITTFFIDGGQSFNFAIPADWIGSLRPNAKRPRSYAERPSQMPPVPTQDTPPANYGPVGFKDFLLGVSQGQHQQTYEMNCGSSDQSVGRSLGILFPDVCAGHGALLNR
jgi:S1-C subfamily serine protease